MKDYVRLNKRVLNVTNIELVEEYFRLEKQLGISPLSYTDVKNHCKYSPDTYTIRFGSWKKFMASIGLKSTNDIDKEDVIKEYYRLKVSLNKRVILGTDFTKYSKYSMTVVNRLFGGWINLLSEIQEDSNYYQRPTDDELITEFYRVKQLLGRDRIYAKDMDQVGKYSRACYIGHFGNWRKFLAHLNENMSRERISNNYLIDEYRRVKEISGKEYITVKDFEKLSGHSFAIFYTRFGSWNKFLISIGETPSYRIDWDNLTNEELVNEYYSVRIKLNKKFPSIDDNDKNGKFMRYVYKKRFGKWSNFIKYVKKLDEQQSNSESLKCIKS